MINEAGMAIIKEFEGLELKAYADPVGILTIGWGHTSGVKRGDTCTKEEAEKFLHHDLKVAEAGLDALVTVPLTSNQRSALISFIFNLGVSKFKWYKGKAPTLRLKLNAGDYTGAANEFPKWVYGGGARLRGLIRRRAKERELFLKKD